jgi:hypothetical protein
MTILQAILLGLLISGLLIATILGYTSTLLFKIKKYRTRIKRKYLIQQLEKLNYFQYHSLEEKTAFIKLMLQHGNGFTKTGLIWNKFTFSLDKRNFLVDEDIDTGSLIIDSEGILQEEFDFYANTQSSHTKFREFTKKLGLNIEIGDMVYSDIAKTKATNKITINNTEYNFYINHEEENYFNKYISEFAVAVNKSLLKIGSIEKVFLMDEDPAILLFLSESIYKYILGLYPVKDERPFEPGEWIKIYH